MTIIRIIHFYFGLAIITHFVITGLLMRMNFFSIESQDTLVRMMLRANHIYILFSGFINLLISYSLKESKINSLYILPASIVILSTIGISAGFYIDPIKHRGLVSDLIQRQLTGYSIQACFAGTVLYLVLLQFHKMKQEKNH